MFGELSMADLRPETTGTGFIIHVYKDVDQRAKHSPRIKVFPGRPSAGNSISISIPRVGEPKIVAGKSQPPFVGKSLAQLFMFVEVNRAVLLQYWYNDLYFTEDLLRDLRRV